MPSTVEHYQNAYKNFRSQESQDHDDIFAEKVEASLNLVFDTYGFTPQEKVIANFILRGLLNSEMAKLLFIQEKSIKFHITHIYKKLGISGRHVRTLHSTLKKLEMREYKKFVSIPLKIYEEAVDKILTQGRVSVLEYKICEKAKNEVAIFLGA